MGGEVVSGEVIDRRTDPRMPAAGLQILQATLRPGRPIRVVDISQSGIRLETDGGLRPGSIAQIRLVSEHWTLVAAGAIVRCEVSILEAERVTYSGALRFEERCTSLPFLNGALAMT